MLWRLFLERSRNVFSAAGLFLAGLSFGFIGKAPIGSFLILLPVSTSVGYPLKELFFPVYIKEAYSSYLRPIPRLILRLLYENFGLDPTPYHLLGGILAGLLAVAAFLCLLNLTGQWAKSLLAAGMTLLAPAVVYDSFYASELDYFGAAFMLFTLLAFLNARRRETTGANGLFAGVFLFTILIKETTAVFLFLLLAFCTAAHWLGGKKPSRGEIFRLGGAALLLGVYFFSFMFTKKNVKNDDITPAFVYFVVRHNLLQFVYLLGFSGAAALFASGLAGARWLKERTRGPAAGFALAVLALFCLATPLLIVFSFYEAIYFSNSIQTHILPLLVLAALVLLATSKDSTRRFFGLFSLAVLAVGVIVPIMVPFSREDVGSKLYIPCLPFLSYLVVDGFATALGSLGKLKPKAAALPALGAIAVAAVMTAHHYALTPVAIFGDLIPLSKAEFGAKSAMAEQNFDGGQVLFFTDYVNFTTASELKMFDRRIRFDNIGFFNQHAEFGRQEDVRYEFCNKIYKMEGNRPLGTLKEAYILNVRKKSLLPDALRQKLTGDFQFTEHDSYFYLQKHRNITWQHWAMGLVPSAQKTTYSDETDLERFLRENGETVFSEDFPFSMPARWLEDAPARTAAGVPWVQPLVYESRLYRIARDVLKCEE